MKTDYSDDEKGKVYINTQDYNNLMQKGTFQSSIYVDNVKKIDSTVNELETMGFKVLVMKNSLSDESVDALQVLTLFRTFVIGVLIIALFFISYFVIRIILRSRKAYYTTLRTLGASRKISKQLLDIELILIATLAYAAFMCLVSLVYAGVITDGYIVDLAENLNTSNYMLIYVIIVAMSYLISYKFSRHLFKDSVMSTYREEV
jgi:predicted lysophospholipase L1 biosynthesis ABC-type transport system permease subunit